MQSIIVCFVGAIAIWVFFVINNQLHTLDIQALEDEVIYDLYGDSVKSAWQDIHVLTLTGEMETWLTHYLEPSSRSEEKPDLLLLHGYGATSAFTWRKTIPALTETFNVYAIDMPGFGRTEAPESLLVDTLVLVFVTSYCPCMLLLHSSKS
jgi:pimeloyl-ACP methyl ester carboxylesterase